MRQQVDPDLDDRRVRRVAVIGPSLPRKPKLSRYTESLRVHAVGGTVKLDLTEAVITGPALQIEAKVRGGNLVLLTKPGIEVDADGVAVLGGNIKVRPSTASKRPAILTVEVSGEVLGGNIVARRSRRALWRSLLRRPGLRTELRSPTGG